MSKQVHNWRKITVRMLLLTMFLLLVSSAATAGPKLYLFDCGRIELESVEMFNLKEDETSVRELFVPCYLIRHDKGFGLVVSDVDEGGVELVLQ